MYQKIRRLLLLIHKAWILIKSGRSIEVFRRALKRGNLTYRKWLDVYYGSDSIVDQALSSRNIKLSEEIFFTIIIPTYNSKPTFLIAAVNSVINQTYSNWELILSDDASRKDTRNLLLKLQASDARIKLKQNLQHLGIAGVQNLALVESNGSFVGFLDHDDLLHKDALRLVSLVIQSNPSLQFIYTDEDKIDCTGHHFDPYFKPDWNPDLLHSQNYINHFSVYSKQLITRMGGFRTGFDGAQDWDLLIRSEKQLFPQEVFHIPVVMYHWRSVKGSTAFKEDEKKDIVSKQRAVLSAYLSENKIDANIERLPNGFWNINRTLKSEKPGVTIIIPTRDKTSLLKTCIESIKDKTSYPSYEILVVDNQSNSETKSLLKKWEISKGIQILDYDLPFNYSQMNNRAAKISQSKVLIFLNNDVQVLSSDWIENLVVNAVRPEIGAVGGMLYYPNGYIQHAGIVLGIGGVAGHIYQGFYKGYSGQFGRAQLSQNYSAVTGSCMAIERSKFLQVEGFDEDNLPIAFNDVDLCLKLTDFGYRNLWLPNVEMIHKESASRGYEDDSMESAQRFRKESKFIKDKWGKGLLMDPAYNPNLNLERFDASISQPPRIDWLVDVLDNYMLNK